MDEKKDATTLSESKDLTFEEENRRKDSHSIEQVVERMEAALNAGEVPEREDGDRLAAYIFKTSPNDLTDSNDENDPVDQEARTAHFMTVHNRYKEARAAQNERIRQEIVNNTSEKEKLLTRMKDLLTSAEPFEKVRQEFRSIREEWDKLGEVEPSLKNEYLSRYQKLMEDFYEVNTLTKEFRDLDFSKNKQIKEGLIETAKTLGESDDVISAFHALQALHDEWKETGPVAPEERDSMWREFKEASRVVNRRHADYFNELKEKEKENLQAKEAICEKVEALLDPIPTTREGWNEGIEKIEQLRQEWRSIGQVPKKNHGEVTKRFVDATGAFFQQRRASAKAFKEKLNSKLEQLEALEQEAVALKDSEDWSATANRLMELQKQWKQVGGVGVRVSKANKLWSSFQGACNHFFERRLEMFKERDGEQEENMHKKLQLVDEFKEALMTTDDKQALKELVEKMQERWGTLGLVPKRHLDSVNDKYYGTLRAAKAKMEGRPARFPNDNRRKDNASAQRPASSSAEHQLEQLIQEHQLLENNLSMFNSSGDPKKNPLIAPLIKKIERLSQQIEEQKEKIKSLKSSSQQ